MAVTTDDDVDARKAAANGLDDVAQDAGDLGSIRELARPQEDRHWFASHGLVDVDRRKTAAVIMALEQSQLLAAMNAVFGVFDVEHQTRCSSTPGSSARRKRPKSASHCSKK